MEKKLNANKMSRASKGIVIAQNATLSVQINSNILLLKYVLQFALAVRNMLSMAEKTIPSNVEINVLVR